jgi:hypothetical protein
MGGVVDADTPPSLVAITIRRSFVTGKFFLGYGTAISIVLGVALAISKGGAFQTTFPFLLPIFVVVGSMGAMVVFTNDRLKGVIEYLLAYGYSTRQVFVTFLLSALALSLVVLVVALGAGVAAYLARGNTLTPQLTELLLVYAVPMAIASTAFGSSVGMFWTALSSPRAGMNSPIGLIPFIGILPSLITLFLLITLAASGIFSQSELPVLAAAMAGTIIVIVLVLFSTMGRFLRRERLLSPA